MTRFKNIVGQESAKRKLDFLLDSYKETCILPHLMVVGEKGCGKTMIARKVGENLKGKIVRGVKPFYEINCSSLDSIESFLSQYFFLKLEDKEGTVFFDEASELKRDIVMSLLTILNPNRENKNTLDYNGRRYLFDFSKQSFIFATTEPQKVFHALMDRCERIDLEPYTPTELGQIIKENIQIPIDKHTLEIMSKVVRGNPRDAQKMAINLTNFINSKKIERFAEADWNSFKYSLGILPLGLNKNELQILKVLRENGASRLAHIAAKTGLTPSSIQRHFEIHLVRNNLVKIETGGRQLTEDGKMYLEKLEMS